MYQVLTFTIKQWAAWAPNLSSEQDWITWSQAPRIPMGTGTLKTDTIPPMIRRRCSQLTNMSLDVASQVMHEQSVDYAVFCSQHGELNCLRSLLSDIAIKEPLMPASFVRSVHNTSAGLFSILQQLHHNMSAIAAGEYTFSMGMMDALTWLKLHPNDTVLLVMADDYLPVEYAQATHDAKYAVAFLLTGQPNQFGAQFNAATSIEKKEMPEALEFLAWFINDSSTPLAQTTIQFEKTHR